MRLIFFRPPIRSDLTQSFFFLVGHARTENHSWLSQKCLIPLEFPNFGALQMPSIELSPTAWKRAVSTMTPAWTLTGLRKTNVGWTCGIDIYLNFHLVKFDKSSLYNEWSTCCTIGPKWCVLKKGVCRKRNTQTRNLREKSSSRFFLLYLHYNSCSSRSLFRYVLPFPSFWWRRRMSVIAGCWHAPDIWIVSGWVGRAWGSWTVDTPVLNPAFSSAKISCLVFLYRDFGEQIEDPRMLDITSETVVKHVIIHVWLF